MKFPEAQARRPVQYPDLSSRRCSCFFAIGFNTRWQTGARRKWVLALNFLLGCAVSLGYLILGAFPLLYADQVFFLLREWKRSSLEYRTGRARSEWASMRSTAASATGWLC